MIMVLGSSAPLLITYRASLMRDLVSKGYRVVGAAPDCTGEIARDLAALGAEALSVPLSRATLNPLSDLGYMQRLEAVFRELKPHTLISYTAKPVIWGALAARRAGVPKIVPMITGLGYAFSEGRELKRKLVRTAMCQLYRKALAASSAVIFQNRDDRSDFIRWGLIEPGKANVVDGSGIDTEAFSPVPMPEQPSFLMLCRLLRDKGVREYCEAAASLRRAHPGIRVRLLGPLDPSPNAIAPKDIALWSGGAVEYGGAVKDVRPAIGDASVYVLPSYYREGVPRSTLEALAMGRAIITTDSPGCRETVTDGDNGYLVPPRNAGALADVMRKFVEDRSLAARMGVRSRELAVRRYDVRKVNRDIMRIAGLD